ncbi:ghrelin O-acyltransferase [Ambystoma mexicanum]|uniref:ghrelin O-acyltransferase n=1 Tax=Ambystoma mexicanum TaxID=8296 RepID=UPI0037E85BCE
MDWPSLLSVHPVAGFQLAAFPFAALYRTLCSFGCLSVNARYVFLLVGGVILSFAAMGPYALLVLTPAFISAFLLPEAQPESVHKWAFLCQMSWQTLCHLWMHYSSPTHQDIQSSRLSISVSSLMLLTQRVTSLALDIHDGKLKRALGSREHGGPHEHPRNVLPLCSYLIFFPALLGGPLCSFATFEKQIRGSISPLASSPVKIFIPVAIRVLGLQGLRVFVQEWVSGQPDFATCSQIDCVCTMWSTALLFKLSYYSHWLLDESLIRTAGFGFQLGHEDTSFDRELSDMDIWTLETTNRMSVFTRTWNRSTSQWLKRLIFQHSPAQPFLMTFVFSAWWHGLYPGQIFGFLCWAVMVEADYRIPSYFSSVLKSRHASLLYRVVTWVQTQLLIAYIMVAIEMRSLSAVCLLCISYCSLFPLLNLSMHLWLVSGNR